MQGSKIVEAEVQVIVLREHCRLIASFLVIAIPHTTEEGYIGDLRHEDQKKPCGVSRGSDRREIRDLPVQSDHAGQPCLDRHVQLGPFVK